jgi:GNAT superfamily N-acetyltransferase
VTEIRAASPRDVDAIARLCDEMDQFYGDTPEAPAQRARQITGALFADPPSAYALLAWDGEQLTGFASYSYLWPASGTSRSLYLKELYVTSAARGSGTGAALMRALSRHAVAHGCKRLEWTTDTSNQDAQAFYAALDVEPEKSKIFYRVTGDALEGLAAPLEGLSSIRTPRVSCRTVRPADLGGWCRVPMQFSAAPVTAVRICLL